MKMILETVSFCSAVAYSELSDIIGTEVEFIHRYFREISRNRHPVLEARLFLVSGLVVHGTVTFIDDEGYQI